MAKKMTKMTARKRHRHPRNELTIDFFPETVLYAVDDTIVNKINGALRVASFLLHAVFKKQ